MRSALKSWGWHVSSQRGYRPCSLNFKLFDSGLVVASRFPILMEDFISFDEDSGGSDFLACKGCLIVALAIPATFENDKKSGIFLSLRIIVRF